MKKSFIASLFVFATMPILAAGSSGVAGKWKVHNNIAGNESDQDCTFVQTDKVLTGACKGDNSEVKISGSVDEKKITWKFDSEYNGNPLTLTYTGTLDESGNIQGDVQVDPMGVTGDFKATPVKADTSAQK
jgi:hypothetical protein